ncbi:hypothetical protein SAMN06893096_101653 [Geodermatophilus pulveris]|uniref:Universal stress protein family protein n=1 Tax=Geodermatophilus pulveris TaxID=1564159 RepID=A0A239BEZ9_9ACTN|nr:hypothetical protein [Geodermatophilus pulveris]SNS06530.1 hypothetical protein SAMN06893096_101653 [Geodermatophilus pulveris]
MTLPLAPPGRTAPPAPTAPAGSPAGTPRGNAPRLLAVVLGRDGAVDVLDAAYGRAGETGQEVHTAVLLPRVPLTLDARLLAGLAEEADREAADLLALARSRAAAAGVPARISLHRLAGLRGRRRERVLDRAVSRLARRLDAVPLRGDGA